MASAIGLTPEQLDIVPFVPSPDIDWQLETRLDASEWDVLAEHASADSDKREYRPNPSNDYGELLAAARIETANGDRRPGCANSLTAIDWLSDSEPLSTITTQRRRIQLPTHAFAGRFLFFGSSAFAGLAADLGILALVGIDIFRPAGILASPLTIAALLTGIVLWSVLLASFAGWLARCRFGR